MATLEKIRNRAGVLIAFVIGLALLAFILGDLLTNGAAMFGGNTTDIAIVADQAIDVNEYNFRVNQAVENGKRNNPELDESAIRDQVWETMIREIVMKDQFLKLGIDICADELEEIVTGNNPSPIIQQYFKDPNTGLFNGDLVKEYMFNLKEQGSYADKQQWITVTKAIEQERASTKYNTLISKGIYYTNKQAELDAKNKLVKADVNYVLKKYTEVKDTTIVASDAEIQSYYEEHIEEFKNEKETRDFDYVVYDIFPDDIDVEDTKEHVASLKEEFATVDNDAVFVTRYSSGSYVKSYSKLGELNPEIDSLMFSNEEGFIYGPYMDGINFKLSKLTEVVQMPDTVKASHILIGESETVSLEQAKATIDSLKTLVDNGADFAELAKKYGTDGTKEKGGDLGWFEYSSMVHPFNDTCFFSKPGDVKVVRTRFGYHLIKVEDRGELFTKVNVSTVSSAIVSSERSSDIVYSKASDFSINNNTAEKFNEAVNQPGLNKLLATVGENDKKFGSLKYARQIVKWVFSAEEGQVSEVFILESEDKYIVAKVSSIKEEGYKELAEVRDIIEEKVITDKKADILIAEFTGSTSINELSKKVGAPVQSSAGITFASYYAPSIGAEANVIATAVSLEKNKMSEPIKGNSGVFVIQVTNKEVPADLKVEDAKNNYKRTIANSVNRYVYDQLKEKANIEDNRSKFE